MQARSILSIVTLVVFVLCGCVASEEDVALVEAPLATFDCGNGVRYPTTLADFRRIYAGRGFGALGGSGAHLGYDVDYAEGTAVHPIACGRVVYYQSATSYGTLVAAVEHRLKVPVTVVNGAGDRVQVSVFLSIYGHLRPSSLVNGGGTRTGLAVGSAVTPDQVIGYVERDALNGDGASHLHLGIRLQSQADAVRTDGRYWLRGYDANSSLTAVFADASSFLPRLRLSGGDARWKSPTTAARDLALDEANLFEGRELAGVFTDGVHSDGVSEAFRDAYDAFDDRLGYAFDNGGDLFVHLVRDLPVQDFKNTRANRFGSDGQTALVYEVAHRKAWLLHDGFWGAAKCIPAADGGPLGGLALLGAPVENEHPASGVDDRCGTNRPGGAQVAAFQNFEHGCMWWQASGDVVHVHRWDRAFTWTELAGIHSACPAIVVQGNPPGPVSPTPSPTPAPAPAPATPTPNPTPSCGAVCTPGQHRCSAGNPSVCSLDAYGCPYWSTGECNPGFACDDLSGQCMAVAAPSAPITLTDDGTTLCVNADRSRLRWTASTPAGAICIAGNLPGIDWSGMPMKSAHGALTYCFARSDLARGLAFPGCHGGEHLSYRFNLKDCGSQSWSVADEDTAGDLVWSGVDDQCTCTKGLALAITAQGRVQVGRELSGSCH